MPSFKVGDIVRCIRQPLGNKIFEGDCYRVTRCYFMNNTESGIEISHIDGDIIGSWYCSRFELVEKHHYKKPKRYKEREYVT